MSYSVNRGVATVFDDRSGDVAFTAEPCDSRNLRYLRVSSEFFKLFFVGDEVAPLLLEHGLPADVKIVAGQYQKAYDRMILLLQSENFSPVPHGEPIPEVDPMPVFWTAGRDEVEPLIPKEYTPEPLL